MRLRNSFLAMLGRNLSQAPQAVVERVRVAMAEALAEHCSTDHEELDRRIHYAIDIAELWYLRADLMTAIATSHHETRARACMARITALFEGYQPGAATPSRLTPL